MKNWNSKTSVYYDIVGDQARNLAQQAVKMNKDGVPVSTIAMKLGKSRSRIYQYLRDE